jgi:hypothetical protein
MYMVADKIYRSGAQPRGGDTYSRAEVLRLGEVRTSGSITKVSTLISLLHCPALNRIK